MIGLPFNPDNCLFIANQALNSNQFNGNVPDTSNRSSHTVLWDFIDNKIYWVNTLNNIIEREIDGNAGSQNESYQILSQNTDSCYLFNATPIVPDNNYLLLPAGTYVFDLEFDVYPVPDNADFLFSAIIAEIRTNTNQSETGIAVTDTVQDYRYVLAPFVGIAEYPLNLSSKAVPIINQTVCSGPVTFANPFIVKSAFSTDINDKPLAAVNNVQLRALLVK